GSATTTEVTVKLTNATIGETLTLTDATGNVIGTKKLAAADVQDGSVTFAGIAIPTEGETLTVKASMTHDANGNAIADLIKVIDTAIVDTTAPKVSVSFNDITSTNDAIDSTVLVGSKHQVKFSFTEEVAGFDLGDVQITSGGGQLSDLTGPTEVNGTFEYTATYTAPTNLPASQSALYVELSISNAAFSDLAGNSNADGNDADNKIQLNVARPAQVSLIAVKDDYISPNITGSANTATNHYGVKGRYEGLVADSGASNNPDSLEGVTNDRTPTVSVTIDGPLLEGQQLLVNRFELDVNGDVVGTPIALDVSAATQVTDAQTGAITYKWTNDDLGITEEGGDRTFTYEASTTAVDGTTTISEKDVSFVVDITAVAPVITDYSITGGIGKITGAYSEQGTIFVDLNKDGIFNLDAGEISTTVNADGTWSLPLTAEQTAVINDVRNYTGTSGNPKVIEDAFDTYLPLSFVDKVGNAAPGFSQFYYFNNDDNGALVSSHLTPADRPETASGGWIEGKTGDYDGDGTPNWELRFDQDTQGQMILVERNITTQVDLGADGRFNIVTGGGNDVMSVKGVQNTNTAVYMGSGNDAYTIGRLAGSGSSSSVLVDMGNGNNRILVTGRASNDAIDLSTIKALEGDDILDVTGGGIRRSVVDLGDGNNQLIAGSMGMGILNPEVNQVTMGSGNDTMRITGNVQSSNINLGNGDNTVVVGGNLEATESYQQAYITLGSGNDTVNIGAIVGQSAKLDTGAGDDTVNIDRVRAQGKVYLGEGSDTLTLDSLEGGSAAIYTGSAITNEDNAVDTVTINNMSGGNVYLGANDGFQVTGTLSGGTVDFTDSNDTTTVNNMSGGTINLGAGNDTLTAASMTGGTINLGDGDDIFNYAGDDIDGIVNAGVGNDTFNFTGSNQDLYVRDTRGFEVFNLNNSGGELNLSYSDLTTAGTQTVFVDGGADDKLDFGSNGIANRNSADGKQFADNDSTAALSTYWTKQDVSNQNGYDMYVFTGNRNGNNTEGYTVYVDTDITVI
ncbi:beta strand repeat-containing protein, partial [Psychrobacter sanguinis]|uniref:beta strand repeat-containing protein n=1 Tax=Psychrobacter sanguinis TaxID=861445 RepID=UPI0013969AED